MANIVEKILEFTSHKVIDLKSFCLLKNTCWDYANYLKEHT